jgi:hypothetical protein
VILENSSPAKPKGEFRDLTTIYVFFLNEEFKQRSTIMAELKKLIMGIFIR